MHSNPSADLVIVQNNSRFESQYPTQDEETPQAEVSTKEDFSLDD